MNNVLVQMVPLLILGSIWFVFGYLVLGRIFRRAGFSQWLGVAACVPLFNILLVIWFAFADWPNLPGPFGTIERPE